MLHRQLAKELEAKYRERFTVSQNTQPTQTRAVGSWSDLVVSVSAPATNENGADPGTQPCQNPIDHIHHLVYPPRADKSAGGC